MENLKITDEEITWWRTKIKHGSEIQYKTTILNHGDHISITKAMYVDGVMNNQELTHVPNELLPKIAEWVGS